jgi:hypothetical protein
MHSYLRGLALRVAGDPSAVLLLACNVIALVLVFSNPPVSMSILFLYWAECAVIGALNVVKLGYTIPGTLGEAEWAQMAPRTRFMYKCMGPGIFVLHYGMFLLVVFLLLYTLGENEMRARGERHYDVWGHLAGFWLPVLVIGSAHVSSFFRNFLGKREYIGRSFEDQMFRPYKRTILLVLVVLGGYGLIALFSLSSMAMLAVAPFALIASLESHFRERSA